MRPLIHALVRHVKPRRACLVRVPWRASRERVGGAYLVAPQHALVVLHATLLPTERIGEA